jgi:hypothetical protein
MVGEAGCGRGILVTALARLCVTGFCKAGGRYAPGFAMSNSTYAPAWPWRHGLTAG